MRFREAQWGWLRRGPLHPDAQLVGWCDGTSSADGAYGWIAVARGPRCDDETLEGVGGSFAPQCDSTMAESFGFLGLTEVIKRRINEYPEPRTWGRCPHELWTTAYAKLLKQLRRPTTGLWASDEKNVLEQMYECDWTA